VHLRDWLLVVVNADGCCGGFDGGHAARVASGFAELAWVEFLVCRIGWLLRPATDGGAFFVVGEKGGFLKTRPLGVTFGGESVEVVEVGFEDEGAVGRAQLCPTVLQVAITRILKPLPLGI
jgi:hypothetical protein